MSSGLLQKKYYVSLKDAKGQLGAMLHVFDK